MPSIAPRVLRCLFLISFNYQVCHDQPSEHCETEYSEVCETSHEETCYNEQTEECKVMHSCWDEEVEECFEVPSEAPSKSNPKFSKWKRSAMNETSGGEVRSERSAGWAKSQTKTICRLVPVKQCSDRQVVPVLAFVKQLPDSQLRGLIPLVRFLFREVCEQVPREKCTNLPVKTCRSCLYP